MQTVAQVLPFGRVLRFSANSTSKHYVMLGIGVQGELNRTEYLSIFHYKDFPRLVYRVPYTFLIICFGQASVSGRRCVQTICWSD